MFKSLGINKWGSSAGQGLVEYALILVLVSVVSIVILAMVGGTVSNVFGNVVCSLETSEDCSVDSGSSGTSTSGTSTSGTSTSGTSTSGTSTSGTSTSGTSTSGTSTSGTSTSGTSTSGTSTSGTSTSGTSTSGTSTSGTSTSGTSTGSLPGGGSPPSINSISDETMDANDTLNVPVSANDVDGDVVVLSIPGAPSFAILNSTGGNGTITFTPSSSDAGSYTITVQAAANGDVVTTDFSLTVNSVGSPPSIVTIPLQVLDGGDTLAVAVLATDPDLDPITLSLVSSPAWASLSSLGGVGTITLSPSVGQTGSYTITVQAVANGDTVTKSFNVTVNAAPFFQNTEAEGMSLTGYGTSSQSYASNGQIVRCNSGTCQATLTFSGASGTYDITTYYIDETDGVSTFTVSVDGTQVDTWDADGTFGCSAGCAAGLVGHTSSSVTINNGDTVRITSNRASGEYGRWDNVEISN